MADPVAVPIRRLCTGSTIVEFRERCALLLFVPYVEWSRRFCEARSDMLRTALILLTSLAVVLPSGACACQLAEQFDLSHRGSDQGFLSPCACHHGEENHPSDQSANSRQKQQPANEHAPGCPGSGDDLQFLQWTTVSDSHVGSIFGEGFASLLGSCHDTHHSFQVCTDNPPALPVYLCLLCLRI
ncbi:MAG: hypothetical protein KatS3mg105_0753 [Gemmatales bacterium]|nr:MAG: hypothetical protein KatS3mg105_0753 [Gemmatales bacterium]